MSSTTSWPYSLCIADWRVGPCSTTSARTLIYAFHHAGGAAPGAIYCHGLYRKDMPDELCGAAWWMPLPRVVGESVAGSSWRSVLHLSRLVVRPSAPRNACSFLLSRSTHMITNDGTYTAFVSYADATHGHTGAIYRACNWAYEGLVGPYPRWQDDNGRQRTERGWGYRSRRDMAALGYHEAPSAMLHKYTHHPRGRPQLTPAWTFLRAA